MAMCPGCDREIRDDIWVCGYCGTLVASASVGPAPGGLPGSTGDPQDLVFAPNSGADGSYGVQAMAYGVSAGTTDNVQAMHTDLSRPSPGTLQRPMKGTTGGLSRAVVLTAIAGLVAVVAIVAVWFFVLRGGPGGDIAPYIGRWQLTVPGATTAQTLAIADVDGEAQLTMTAPRAGETATQAAGPYRMEFDGDRLYTTFEPAAEASEEQKLAAEMVKSAFGAMVDDFKMVIAVGSSPDTLTLSVEGDLKDSGGTLSALDGQSLDLSRAPAAQ